MQIIFVAPLQTVTQPSVDLTSCDEKHSAMAAQWAQLALWFIEIHYWPLLSHQLCGESQTDISQFLSLLSVHLVSSYCQTFFSAYSSLGWSHLSSKATADRGHLSSAFDAETTDSILLTNPALGSGWKNIYLSNCSTRYSRICTVCMIMFNYNFLSQTTINLKMGVNAK